VTVQRDRAGFMDLLRIAESSRDPRRLGKGIAYLNNGR